jgi:hypothetical protein
MGVIDKFINKRVNNALKDKFKNVSGRVPKNSNILGFIRPETLDRITKNIGDWRDAVENAEDIDNPDREELIEMYRDFVDDYQLFSAMQTRINKAISGAFRIMDEEGEIDEQETRKFLDPKGFPLPWFREFMQITMLSKFYGYEVIQLGDIADDKFLWIEKFPEENLIPYYHTILIDARQSFIPGSSDNQVDITQPPQRTWLIGVGSETDLGLINKCAPYIIYKTVFGSWSEHADRFGMPLRVGKTDLRDNERRQNLIDMFEEMTGSTYVIQDYEDEVELIEQKSGNDPHNIYGELISKCDQAISKIVLGQTGTTDEKTHVGSAGVHKGILDDIIFSDKLDISKEVNEKLIPRMKNIGMIDSGKKVFGQWDFSEQIDISKHVENIQKLSMSGYVVPSEEVIKKTGYDVDTSVIAVPDNKMVSVMNKVTNLYKEHLKDG